MNSKSLKLFLGAVAVGAIIAGAVYINAFSNAKIEPSEVASNAAPIGENENQIAANDAQVAEPIVLKLHHFLPPQSTIPAQILGPWADKIEAAADGRIKIDRYPAMQLGGRPPELIDQALDGVADIVMTVIGYTPGRFPSTEVFELPFIMSDAGIASCAFSKMYDTHMAKEFNGVRVLGTWVHGPGHLHTKEPVESPEDLVGMKIRGGSRVVNDLLQAAGATPVGMPLPGVPESLSKGVIDGATLPWEVTTVIKVPELVSNHTEFEGAALYTLTFILAMNEAKYNSLPDDLKTIIDENSHFDFSVFAGNTQQAADDPARAIAEELGNSIVTISDIQPWRDLVLPIYDKWVADVAQKGVEGQLLIEQAQSLMSGACASAKSDF